MLIWIYTHHVLLVAIALCAAFAAWKGDWPERIAAYANLAGSLIYYGIALFTAGIPGTVNLCLDLALALIFLALAIRFASLWLGAAMLLQAAQFSLHAYYFVSERQPDDLYSIMNNVVSWGVLACIITGVSASWFKRARIASAPPTTHAPDVAPAP